MLFVRRRSMVFLVALCAVVGGFCLPELRAQTSFTTVVVFGDSLSDTGNIANLTQSQYKVRYPSDNTLLGFDYTDGRFTDGTDTQPAASTAYTGVWVEQMAALFGGKVTIKDSLDGGTNYAYGDATTGAGTTTESKTFEGVAVSITLNNMGQQVTSYLGTHPTPNAQTLYVLWGGANDLLNAATGGQDPTAVAVTAAGNELALVQQLYAAGARNFMIPNLPPLGAFAASKGASAVTALNTASAVFAQALTKGLGALKQSSMDASLTFYQPDIFSLFATVAADPTAVGLGDVSTAADTVKVSPDTFLIWDGLHPTTTGHHLVAATAANLLQAQVASTSTLTLVPAGLAGQPVTISAKVTSAETGNVPTGLVTFFNGTTVAGSAAVDATGTATLTFTPAGAAGTDYALVAVYAGDVVNLPSAAPANAFPLLGTAVGTTTMLSSSSANADLGATVTFTATVTPASALYGSPSAGIVTFLDGTTTLGTGVVMGTTATFATSSLAAGSHSITAVFGAAGLFAGSTSAALTETVTAPGFTATASPMTLTLASGGSGTVNLTATFVGGYAGTVTMACGTLPAHFACSIPVTPQIIVAGESTSLLVISTNAPSSTARLEEGGPLGASRVLNASLLLPGVAGLLCLGLRRRRKGLGGVWLPATLAVLATGVLLGAVGCGSSNNAPAGSYTVPVVFTATASGGATPASQTVNITVTVQ